MIYNAPVDSGAFFYRRDGDSAGVTFAMKFH